MKHKDSASGEGISRRSFFKGIGAVGIVATAASRLKSVAEELENLNDERKHGPGAVPVTLKINGESRTVEVEPRATLLDVLRNRLSLTGSKEVCDRATCGACTVLLDGVPVYACMKLAIDAQGQEITTIEGLSKGDEMTPVQKAFVDNDGLMCGYCTPGFVMSVTALLEKNPKPTEDEVRQACAGNLCRCGTYPQVWASALDAAGVKQVSKLEVIRDGGLA